MKSCLLFLACCLLTACDKFVEVPPTSDLIGLEAAFSSDAVATTTVKAIYSRMVREQDFFSDALFSLYLGLAADELNSTGSSGQRDPFQNNELTDDNALVFNNFWRRGYELVYNVNLCVEGLQQSRFLSEPVRKLLSGEVRLIRAFLYFHLVNVFGDVPWQTTTNYKINEILPRMAVQQILASITADALYATEQLQTWHTTRTKFRPSKEAAQAMLAKLYLYQGNWAQAEAAATSVIGTGDYILEENLQQVFRRESAEAIWQLDTAGGVNLVQEAGIYLPAAETQRPAVVISKSLLQAFEAGDQRKTNWLKAYVLPAATYYAPYKFRVRSGVNVTEAITLSRLAEVYLLRAEARVQQDKREEACADLNRVRKRAGLDPLAATLSTDEILKAVEQERRIELMFEFGNRWCDLKRTNRADTVLGAEKGRYWQATDTLFPIPKSEIERNDRLTQNEGYD